MKIEFEVQGKQFVTLQHTGAITTIHFDNPESGDRFSIFASNPRMDELIHSLYVMLDVANDEPMTEDVIQCVFEPGQEPKITIEGWDDDEIEERFMLPAPATIDAKVEQTSKKAGHKPRTKSTPRRKK